MNNRKKYSIVFSLIVLLALVLSACSGTKENSKSNNITIVTSTNIYSDIAKQVVGKYGTAESLITNGNSDPHDFEPTTASAKTVSKADIVVANGMGYDSWMDNLAKSSNKKVVKVGNDLLKLSNTDNPHIWYNLKMPVKYVNYLVKRLSKLDSKHSNYYKQNGKKYLNKIAKIDKLASSINGKKQKPVFVSEPVFDYALERTGFKVGNRNFEEATEKETDPSAAVIAKMNHAIEKKQIAFFVNNTQASSDTVKSFVKKAKSKNIPIIEVRETMPNGTSYYNWMLSNYQKLAKFSK